MQIRAILNLDQLGSTITPVHEIVRRVAARRLVLAKSQCDRLRNDLRRRIPERSQHDEVAFQRALVLNSARDRESLETSNV